MCVELIGYEFVFGTLCFVNREQLSITVRDTEPDTYSVVQLINENINVLMVWDVLLQSTKSFTSVLQTLLMGTEKERYYRYHSNNIKTIHKGGYKKSVLSLLHCHYSRAMPHNQHEPLIQGKKQSDKPSAKGTTINALSTNTVLVRC